MAARSFTSDVFDQKSRPRSGRCVASRSEVAHSAPPWPVPHGRSPFRTAAAHPERSQPIPNSRNPSRTTAHRRPAARSQQKRLPRVAAGALNAGCPRRVGARRGRKEGRYCSDTHLRAAKREVGRLHAAATHLPRHRHKADTAAPQITPSRPRQAQTASNRCAGNAPAAGRDATPQRPRRARSRS